MISIKDELVGNINNKLKDIFIKYSNLLENQLNYIATNSKPLLSYFNVKLSYLPDMVNGEEYILVYIECVYEDYLIHIVDKIGIIEDFINEKLGLKFTDSPSYSRPATNLLVIYTTCDSIKGMYKKFQNKQEDLWNKAKEEIK